MTIDFRLSSDYWWLRSGFTVLHWGTNFQLLSDICFLFSFIHFNFSKRGRSYEIVIYTFIKLYYYIIFIKFYKTFPKVTQ
jgi:DMSO/TMAO reductase YedYZ heme-binding membrane subunit